MAETCIGYQILPQRLYWSAHVLLVLLFDAAHNTALPAELRSIRNIDVANETRLSTHHAVFAKMR